jgi:hypothetical protein
MRVVRGGNVFDTVAAELTEYMAIENTRSVTLRFFGLGLRCAERT